MYIADRSNLRIRRVDPTTGVISTYAGNGIGTGSISGIDSVGDGGPATSAEVFADDLCIDSCGNLFFVEGSVNVRAVTASGPGLAVCAPPSLGVPASIKECNVYPNPATNQLTIDNPIADGARYEIMDMIGRTILHGDLQAGTQHVDIHKLPPGNYIINMYTSGERSYTATVVKE